MKHLGILLFGLGMLVAICAAAKLTDHARFQAEEAIRNKQTAAATEEEADKKQQDDGREAPLKTTFPSTWPIFTGSIVCAIAGICLWRGDRAGQQSTGAETPADQDPVALLAGMQPKLQTLQKEISKLKGPAIIGRLDEISENFVFPFNLSRGLITDRLGMRDGAEVLIAFAGAERLLNRSWSAASDGHGEESATSLSDAVQAFADADRLLQKFLAKSP